MVMDQGIISRKLKALRKSRNISLSELAEKVGLTKGYLSRIENSENPPPISTLGKIASALGTDITDLFPKVPESVSGQELVISRNHEVPQINGRGTIYGYNYQNLAVEKKGKNMEPFIMHPPRAADRPGGEFDDIVLPLSVDWLWGRLCDPAGLCGPAVAP